MDNTHRSTHPLILVAACSLTLASLAATAHLVGLAGNKAETPASTMAASALPAPPIPTSLPAGPSPANPGKTEAPTTLTIPPGATVTVAAEGSKPPRRVSATQHRESPALTPKVAGHGSQSSRTSALADPGMLPENLATPAVRNLCRDCGSIEAVREIAPAGEGSGLGAIAGGVIGGLLGHQVGHGKGKDLATIAAAVGGAYAGNQVEKTVRGEKQVEVTVRFDDGTVHTYLQSATANWYRGERVRLANGSLIPA